MASTSTLMAPYVDGELQTQSTSGDSLTQKTKKKNSEVDSDMFLTLLVAEMQNQDPLEPTSNTEWVSQYATFTQVEKMTEMSESVDLLRANSLVGQNVIMKVTSESTGAVTYENGIVDYVLVENGKAILVINDKKYSLSDLDTVISGDYSSAYDKYTSFSAQIKALPSVKLADKTYEAMIRSLLDTYNDMTDYEKNYMSTYAADEMNILAQWVKKMEDLGFDFTKEKSDKTSATLDDILNTFNEKMDAILEKLTADSGEDSNSETETDTETDTKTD